MLCVCVVHRRGYGPRVVCVGGAVGGVGAGPPRRRARARAARTVPARQPAAASAAAGCGERLRALHHVSIYTLRDIDHSTLSTYSS